MSLPAVSKHLKVLERAGLIAKSREAQWRLCRLEAAPLREVASWMEPYRRFWASAPDKKGEAKMTEPMTTLQVTTPVRP